MAHNALIRGQTTIAAGSDGVALPTGTINVASTTGPPAFAAGPGTLTVVTTAGVQQVAYTAKTGTTFTGCTGGTGTMHTGGAVADAWQNIGASEIIALANQLVESINAVDGGCWAPVAPIVISGSGLNLSVPLVIARGGSLLANGTAAVVLGDNDFPVIDPVDNVFAKRTVLYPCADSRPEFPGMWQARRESAAMQAYAPVIDQSDGQGPLPVRLFVRIRAHDGATFSKVTVHFRVGQPHSSVPPTMPKVRMMRIDASGNSASMVSQANGADASGYVAVPTPSNQTAWYANGGHQSLSITCDQNNVADVSQYDYQLEIVEQAGISGFPWTLTYMKPVRLWGNKPLTLIGVDAGGVGGIQPADGDRVLVSTQVDARQNGIWIAQTSGPWMRAPDLQNDSQFVRGMVVPVQMPSSAVLVSNWKAGVTFAVGSLVTSSVPANGFWFVASAITTGISGGSEPAWVTTSIGSTTTDAGVTWKCLGRVTNGAGLHLQVDPSRLTWKRGDQPDALPSWVTATTVGNFSQGIVPTQAKATGYWYSPVNNTTTTSSGNTGATEPAWPTGVGATVTDGPTANITWVCRGKATDPMAFGVKPDKDVPVPGTDYFVPHGNLWQCVQVDYTAIQDFRPQ